MEDLKIRLELEGYSCVRQLKSGEWVGLHQMFYTTALCVGLDEGGYKERFCYETYVDAMKAVETYEGGDPDGPWIKAKGVVERLGPGVRI